MPHFTASKTTTVDPKRFADDVGYYLSLTPRQLPSQYLYDDLGSALFEAICCLPWYRITRTEQYLLGLSAARIFDRLPGVSTLIELGPGSGAKLATVLDAHTGRALRVHLVDVSTAALRTATEALRVFPNLTIVPHHASYESGLAQLGRPTRGPGLTLMLFLGSNIGNFDPPGANAFLRSARSALSAGDGLLLGTDLVKPEADMLLAYDDPLGVTAAFNRNLLVRANRELDADFDIHSFTHRAIWNDDASRIEMHLVSNQSQRVHVPLAGLDMAFAAGETIWTESSYKYREESIVEMLDRAGFNAVEKWVDEGYALTLALAR